MHDCMCFLVSISPGISVCMTGQVPDAWDEIVPVQLPRFVIDRIVKVCGHELAIFKDGGLNAALTQASPVVLLPDCTGWLDGKDSSRLHLFRLCVDLKQWRGCGTIQCLFWEYPSRTKPRLTLA